MNLLIQILSLQMLCLISYGQNADSTKEDNTVTELEQQFFPPHKLRNEFQFHFSNPFSEINITTADGYNLHGLIFKVKQSKGLIFYLHGSLDAVHVWGKIAPAYNHLNYDIFIPDYRGYGKSEGIVADEAQLSGDIQSLYDKLKQNYSESNIIIIGQSMGTGPAAQLASNNNPKALILQAPYYSLSDWIYHIAPEINTSKMKFQFKTFETLPKIKAPIVIFHGDSDNAVYYGSSKKLSAFFKKGDELITLKGEGHNNFINNLRYLAKIRVILQ